ncbi:hypothetical protein C9374_011807 [Naegleria lovaniensis]|uniref:Uncharacterized protein n=1 Tax=Naegleria lovaniensis TaxID=51637 RepID=A0AA88GEH7_NAELO|nr:uncharacterized protein C9374_011807 [Naegleria lovaniensis]KAG2373718.1 hypothetical protein C9374_011807 [Naegleria lovaniensis]
MLDPRPSSSKHLASRLLFQRLEPEFSEHSQYEINDPFHICLDGIATIGIKQVHVLNYGTSLYLVSNDGILYQLVLDRANQMKTCSRLGTVAPFDGSTNLRVEQIASYTEAMLLIVKDIRTKEYFIYGTGNNSYFRMTHDKHQNFHCSKIERLFSPLNRIQNAKPPTTINHVGCAYSFSCCVINNFSIHITGQDWVNRGTNNSRTGDGYHCWSKELQKFASKIIKVDCGDFHVLLLHEDKSISIGGNDFHSSVFTVPLHFTQPFYTIPISVITCFNLFSGSNSALYISNCNNQSYIEAYCIDTDPAWNSHEEFEGHDPIDQWKVKYFGNNAETTDHIIDIQYAKDYLIIRYNDQPYLMHIIGSSYYGSRHYNNEIIDLRTLIPSSVGNYKEIDFYRTAVKVTAHSVGFSIYCDLGDYSLKRFSHQLFATTNPYNTNNSLLFDVSIIHNCGKDL